MSVAFLPFPTKVMAEYFGETDPERIAVGFYGSVLVVIALLMDALWRCAVARREITGQELKDDELRGLTSKSAPSLGLFVGSTALGPSSRRSPSSPTSCRRRTWSSPSGRSREPWPSGTDRQGPTGRGATTTGARRGGAADRRGGHGPAAFHRSASAQETSTTR
jgi:hypothetical protein